MSSKSTFSVSKNSILLACDAAEKGIAASRKKAFDEAVNTCILKRYNMFCWIQRIFPWVKQDIIERSEVEEWLNRPDNSWNAWEWTHTGGMELATANRLKRACYVCHEDYANLDSDDAGFVQKWLPIGESK